MQSCSNDPEPKGTLMLFLKQISGSPWSSSNLIRVERGQSEFTLKPINLMLQEASVHGLHKTLY